MNWKTIFNRFIGKCQEQPGFDRESNGPTMRENSIMDLTSYKLWVNNIGLWLYCNTDAIYKVLLSIMMTDYISAVGNKELQWIKLIHFVA